MPELPSAQPHGPRPPLQQPPEILNAIPVAGLAIPNQSNNISKLPTASASNSDGSYQHYGSTVQNASSPAPQNASHVFPNASQQKHLLAQEQQPQQMSHNAGGAPNGFGTLQSPPAPPQFPADPSTDYEAQAKARREAINDAAERGEFTWMAYFYL